MINFKYIPGEDSFYFIISKQDWRFPDEDHAVSVPLEVRFDNTDLGIGADARGFISPRSHLPLVDFFVNVNEEENKNLMPRFLEAFAHADKMTIRFKEGNEAQWSFDMKGSRGVIDSFSKCLANLPRAPQATLPYSKTPPSQPYDADKAAAAKNGKDI
jgi:hypothetical protein